MPTVIRVCRSRRVSVGVVVDRAGSARREPARRRVDGHGRRHRLQATRRRTPLGSCTTTHRSHGSTTAAESRNPRLASNGLDEPNTPRQRPHDQDVVVVELDRLIGVAEGAGDDDFVTGDRDGGDAAEGVGRHAGRRPRRGRTPTVRVPAPAARRSPGNSGRSRVAWRRGSCRPTATGTRRNVGTSRGRTPATTRRR